MARMGKPLTVCERRLSIASGSQGMALHTGIPTVIVVLCFCMMSRTKGETTDAV